MNASITLLKLKLLASRFVRQIHHTFYESFLNGTSCSYIEQLHQTWTENPSAVHTSWATFFKLVESGSPPSSTFSSPNSPITVKVWKEIPRKAKTAAAAKSGPIPKESIVQPTVSKLTGTQAENETRMKIEAHLNLFAIIHSYQRRGHLMASLDPLNIVRGPLIKKRVDTERNPILRYWNVPKDLSLEYELPDDCTFIGRGRKKLNMKDVVTRLEEAYCQSIGVEVHHVENLDEKHFIVQFIESNKTKLDPELKKLCLQRLCRAHHFELFLSKKWPSEKRFGLEGCEVYIPAMRYIMEVANTLGAGSFVLGMAHRGRLNTLANILEKPLADIFGQFQPMDPSSLYSEGDVKYHLGSATQIKNEQTGAPIQVSMCANASHLESVNPIVTGKTAAKQVELNDATKTKVWPILIHGDAAVCGQGVVYETIHLAELHCYSTGGTIHVIINNQIGFTTDPYRSRSSEYCSAVGKVINAPILHVNADDVEAVMLVCELAAKYRATFKNDIVIDIIGYRKFGHNEVDEPMFTQPIMYSKIHRMTPIYEKYKVKMIEEEAVSAGDVSTFEKVYFKELEDAFVQASSVTKYDPENWVSSPWENFFKPEKDQFYMPVTGTDESVIEKIGLAMSTPPPNFNLHRGLQRIFTNRRAMLTKNKVADWAMGEAFAFASLMQEGIPVRLSGQDCERGTFSHRHHVVHDQENGKRINLLENIFANQAKYTLCNSSLSEFGILGFELGVSISNPNILVMWEAQFGDFCNSAQIVIDQYVSSGQTKWHRQSGLVMLLPHGLEGQGPEHSSARPERFLQMCNDDDMEIVTNMPQQMKNANWFVVNASTPANFFHVIRRQLKLNYRKPLIIFTPKALLRLPDCVSPLKDFTGGSTFKPYIPDPDVRPSDKVKKLLLCTGKVYYELKAMREKLNLMNEVAIGRVEQLCPLPYEELTKEATFHYPNCTVAWVQEEHKNQGGWGYISPRINKVLGKYKGAITYIGRPTAASPATGHKLIFPREKEQFLLAAMT